MCRFPEVIHKNGTESAQNGTTALARAWQNGTVPCRLCRVPSCAVCADSLSQALMAEGATEWEKAFIRGCLEHGRKHGELTDKQHTTALSVVGKIKHRVTLSADPRFAAWAAGSAK